MKIKTAHEQNQEKTVAPVAYERNEINEKY